jgi:hypothetical protein
MAAGQVVSRARRHASMLAAKVAAVFLVFRLITRRLNPAHIGGAGLVAVVVPMVALSVQPSSAATPPRSQLAAQTTPANPVPATAPAGASSKANTLTLPAGSALPLALPAPSVSVPALPLPSSVAGVAGVAGSATNTVNHVAGTLPSPLPIPTPLLPTPPVIK